MSDPGANGVELWANRGECEVVGQVKRPSGIAKEPTVVVNKGASDQGVPIADARKAEHNTLLAVEQAERSVLHEVDRDSGHCSGCNGGRCAHNEARRLVIEMIKYLANTPTADRRMKQPKTMTTDPQQSDVSVGQMHSYDFASHGQPSSDEEDSR
ncbi:MAG: hypothetical protein JO054_18840 [Actinobacteria bacterium]|nr:hypothetical protein [Actinomycetota bacterium]